MGRGRTRLDAGGTHRASSVDIALLPAAPATQRAHQGSRGAMDSMPTLNAEIAPQPWLVLGCTIWRDEYRGRVQGDTSWKNERLDR